MAEHVNSLFWNGTKIFKDLEENHQIGLLQEHLNDKFPLVGVPLVETSKTI